MSDPATWAAVATVVGGGAAVATAMKKPPKMPEQPTMVEPDAAAMEAARKRQAAELQSRGGRASTILTGDERLGG